MRIGLLDKMFANRMRLQKTISAARQQLTSTCKNLPGRVKEYL